VDLVKYKRIAHALAESQRINAELEARVRQKEQELERNFDKLERLSRKAAVTDERQRIMTDMHDGIGANLISALCLAESGDAAPRDIAAVLRECIDDLRLTIDSLESGGDELLPALGNFRWRIEGRLARMGIELEWRVDDLPALPDLSPRKLLHILRILQEAVANVLKHAQATRIRLEATVFANGQGVSIRVSDNGKGLAMPGTEGRGLGNMARRAASVGGHVSVSSTAEGTTVELQLPIDRADAAIVGGRP
jgi:signal transduction histidine kinase